ncbi:hypothetical protein [Arthrobacter sp. ok909]|nr:hypothetical protein [Arthrobacter sp. ok909]
MVRRTGGYYAKDSKREIRRRQLRALAYVGLGVLAIATAVVVVWALRR